MASEHTIHTIKSRLVEAFGGGCCICDYSRCNNALQLHHVDPDTKDFSFGSLRANPQSYLVVAAEAEKCVLVCANCHAELHAGLITLPKHRHNMFDAALFLSYYEKQQPEDTTCPECGKIAKYPSTFCSKSCAGKSNGRKQYRVQWSVHLLQPMIARGWSNVRMGEELGVSGTSVRRARKRLGI